MLLEPAQALEASVPADRSQNRLKTSSLSFLSPCLCLMAQATWHRPQRKELSKSSGLSACPCRWGLRRAMCSPERGTWRREPGLTSQGTSQQNFAPKPHNLAVDDTENRTSSASPAQRTPWPARFAFCVASTVHSGHEVFTTPTRLRHATQDNVNVHARFVLIL